MHVGRIALTFVVLAAALAVTTPVELAAAEDCNFWIARGGSDSADGSKSDPWATVTHAVEAVPDNFCTITVKSGVYHEAIEIERRFSTSVKIRAARTYRTIFELGANVLDIDGARSVVIVGFVFRHDGPGAGGQVINVDNGGGVWAERITLKNNIIHDSYGDDLLKIHAGVKNATVVGNVFYNQGPGEQHMDVNSVTDIKIQDNIFFNDFARSGRGDGDSKHFIVVKDSNVFDDGLRGSERITIRRNVFMNWQGDVQSFIQIGNGGHDYHEAKDVNVENNLFLGNSDHRAVTPLGVSGARDVSFINNTVVGDLPTMAYGLRAVIKGANPINRNLTFVNNIWSDPTGTMDDFSGGDAGSVQGLVLDNNLYWNGGKRLPDGDVGEPRDDAHRVVANPGLATNHHSVVVPFWTGTQFLSGRETIRAEFERLVNRYASIPVSSPAVDRSDPARAPSHDILGEARVGAADLGAFEAGNNPAWCAGLQATHVGTAGNDKITGTPQRDVIVGRAGDDVISGRGGNDVICGSAGDDTIIGGSGADHLRGGTGNDRIEGRGGADHILGGDGADSLHGNGGSDNIEGDSGDDLLRGDQKDDVLDGGPGTDTAVGGGGYDQCRAEDASCESVLAGVGPQTMTGAGSIIRLL